MSINTRLQQLAITCRVPAWNVMIDFKSDRSLNEIVLLNAKGHYIHHGIAQYEHAWERMELAMRDFAATAECRAGWSRYEGEGCPMISTFGEL